MGRESQPSLAGSVTTTLRVLVSLGLNAFLATQLLHRRPSLLPQAASAASFPGKRLTALASALVTTNAAAISAATNALPPFLWSSIESADYRQYIANLRAVGCPEQVIRDIITVDLNQLFAQRAATIWKPRLAEYWQKRRNDQPDPEQLKQLTALALARAP